MMNKESNFFAWQQKKVNSRLNSIKNLLLDLSASKVSFKSVSDLARYISKALSDDSEGTNYNFTHESMKICSAKGLMKSAVYRPIMEAWMLQSKSGLSSLKNTSGTVAHRLELLELSNANAVLKSRVHELETQQSRGSNGGMTDSVKRLKEISDAYYFVELLLAEFSDFVLSDGKALVKRSASRKVLVPSELYLPYVEWRSGLLERRGDGYKSLKRDM